MDSYYEVQGQKSPNDFICGGRCAKFIDMLDYALSHPYNFSYKLVNIPELCDKHVELLDKIVKLSVEINNEYLELKKPKLYIDVDNTILATNVIIPVLYEQKSGIKLKKHLSLNWNMQDCFYKEEDYNKQLIHELFETEEFFDSKYIYNGAKEVLRNLTKYWSVNFCSCGTKRNLELKKAFLLKEFPFIPESNLIMLEQGKDIFDKSCCSGKGSCIIDDKFDCLDSANTDYKILYRNNNEELVWQEGYQDRIGKSINFVATAWDKTLETCLTLLAHSNVTVGK